jgi:hypothetical protein
VTGAEARQIAREQNDADHAAGLLPSRYVECEATLAKVARLVLAEPADDGGPPPSPRAGRRHHKQTVKSSTSQTGEGAAAC